MSANSFGTKFVVTTFGESHGAALGVVIDGCPAQVPFDLKLLELQLARRRPGHHGSGQIVSSRQEADVPEVLSGVFENKTLGTPIALLVRNQDQRSEDYSQIKQQPRAGHADDVWLKKFGHSDHRGGGRSSGRETVARVMAGAVAQMFVKSIYPDLEVKGYALKIGPFELTTQEVHSASALDIDQYQARFPSDRHLQLEKELREAQAAGESWGGVAQIQILQVPTSLGQPVFRKLKSDFAQAFLSVGAVNGFELGEGFAAAAQVGTQFHQDHSPVYGGIRGGISTGEDVFLKASFKPTSSILDIAKKGRHDPCIVTRAIPVLEAMVWLVLAEHVLWSRLDK